MDHAVNPDSMDVQNSHFRSKPGFGDIYLHTGYIDDRYSYGLENPDTPNWHFWAQTYKYHIRLCRDLAIYRIRAPMGSLY